MKLSTPTSATSISAPAGSTGGTFADLQGHAAMDNTEDSVEVQRLVNKMTNRQRNKWAKAGYPGLRLKEPEKIKPFVPGEPYIVEN